MELIGGKIFGLSHILDFIDEQLFPLGKKPHTIVAENPCSRTLY